MKLFRYIFIISILLSQYLQAGTKPDFDKEIIEDIDLSAYDSIATPDEVIYALDHMLSNWYLSQVEASVCDSVVISSQVPDSVIKERLQQLPYIMEMPFNQHVKSFIDLYTLRRRNQLSNFRALGDYYFTLFEEVLDKYDLPLELKYLPIIESALNTTAISRAGAAGLWQFMYGTAKIYGLEMNSLIDERMDPYKSTEAAAKFLRDLYNIYGDWHLVIAAYNCGPGNVNKAIRRAGDKRDYWAIYPYLPRETRGYVPIFIAANYAMHYADDYAICKANIDFPNPLDTVVVNQRLHFKQISEILNIPNEQIKQLNPQYRKEIIPGDLKPYAVVLPVHLSGSFIDKMEEIASFKADSLINNRRTEISAALASHPSAGGKATYHTVRSGETLSGIGARYGVSVARLQQWNNIKGSLIRPGQRLTIRK